ncbi:MAG: caspase family protein [bacterium]
MGEGKEHPISDASRIFLDAARAPEAPGTHVLIIGVGRYAYGKGAGASPVAGDLRQLTSPPISARAMADWFLTSFKNAAKPLSSVSLMISDAQPSIYQPPRPAGAPQVQLPAATLANVKEAARHWADRVGTHQDNLAVFYFCGHGASLGQQAALLLHDFGEPGAEFDGAIDLDVLRGTMRNSPAIQQVYLLDCCRTDADDFYRNEAGIGSRVVSVASFQRKHSIPPQQFVLFPTIDGEEAFGIKGTVSVFTSSMIDAMSFAAADGATGVWRTTTGSLLSTVDQLVRHRVPEPLAKRSKPNALDASSFDFNVIDEPLVAHSYVTISDLDFWGQVEIECVDPEGAEPTQRRHSSEAANEMCCTFELHEGRWCFRGMLPDTPPSIQEHERTLRVPVAYVKLEVTP